MARQPVPSSSLISRSPALRRRLEPEALPELMPLDARLPEAVAGSVGQRHRNLDGDPAARDTCETAFLGGKAVRKVQVVDAAAAALGDEAEDLGAGAGREAGGHHGSTVST
jgi:hypothetical protein